VSGRFLGAYPASQDLLWLALAKGGSVSLTISPVTKFELPFAKNHNASGAMVGFDLHFHTLAKTTLTGLFGH
jgi:hypothetical protein